MYLAENPRAGNIFNPYEWGGYLLWKNPSSEIFIDGRGPQVKVDQNKSILEEYFQFLADDETIKNKISKYGISRIVIKKQESVKLDFVNSFFAKYLVSSSEMKVMNKETNLVIYLSQSEDWKKAYEDSNSIVYDKK